MPSATVELSWWQLQVLLTVAWLMTMYVSFQAGLQCQQFRMSFEEKLTADEMNKSLPEVFMVEKGSVLHLSSTCSSLSRSNADLMRWCSKCSWKKQKHQAKNERAGRGDSGGGQRFRCGALRFEFTKSSCIIDM